MLPFGLKIAWFVLSLTGLLSCWVVLWAFGRAVGAKWVSSLYCIGNTLLQGMFCLGMIYRMDPFAMPRAFCIAQTVVISFGAFLMAGLAMAFSLATSITVLKPKTWSDGERALRWRTVYTVPIVAFPIIASTIHVIFIVKSDSVHPTDEMHCDSSSPEWVRLLGYAGLPFVLSWPSLYLSVKSIYRVYKINQHLQRARPDSIDDIASIPQLRRKKSGMANAVFSSVQAKTIRRDPASPTIYNAALVAGRFNLPFRSSSSSLHLSPGKRGSAVFSGEDIDLNDSASSSKVSVSFPTFTEPGAGTELRSEQKDRTGSRHKYDLGDRNALPAADRKNDSEARTSDSVNDGEGEWEGKGDLAESDIAKEEYVISETESPSRPRSRTYSAMTGMPYRKSRPPPPNLAPAIWRIILFQVAFISIQFLTCISTVIDLLTRRPTPSPLGTQHVALLLAAWGPVIVFGHLPAVRRNLVPWRPISR